MDTRGGIWQTGWVTKLTLARQGLQSWTRRQWLVAIAGAAVTALLMGVATVLIPNGFFRRDIAPEVWNYPIWLLTSVLAGLLIGTYAAPAAQTPPPAQVKDRSVLGMTGAMLGWFAVGCPVCNKIALLALGYTGALTWFAPLQPILAVAAVVLLGYALVQRLAGQIACSTS